MSSVLYRCRRATLVVLVASVAFASPVATPATGRLVTSSTGQVSGTGQVSANLIYHGNTDSKIFHQPACRYYNCKACTRSFSSREAAINAGYKACKICKP